MQYREKEVESNIEVSAEPAAKLKKEALNVKEGRKIVIVATAAALLKERKRPLRDGVTLDETDRLLPVPQELSE